MLVWMSSSAYFLSAQPRRLDEFFELTNSTRTEAHGCQQHENVGSAQFSLLPTKNMFITLICGQDVDIILFSVSFQ